MKKAIEELLEGLASEGFAVSPNFLDEATSLALLEDLKSLRSVGRFRAAGVGRGVDHVKNEEVRRDEICWFEPAELLPAQQSFWAQLTELKTAINQSLFLGLWDLEGHFAVYPPGGFYIKHVDRFKSDDARTISIVAYLNEAWEKPHGGELAIYRHNGDTDPVVVEPRLGTLVCFLSDRIEHEVMESRRERKSFAGWFRRR